MAAGRDDDIAVILPQHTVVFPLHLGSAEGSFLRVMEAQPPQRFPHAFDSHAGIVCDKGRRQGGHNGLPALDHYLHLFRLVHNLLGILRTDNKTGTAQDALIADNMGLVSRKADGFHRAVPDTFITVFTVCFFQCQAVRHAASSLQKGAGRCFLRPVRIDLRQLRLHLFLKKFLYAFR